MTKTNITLLSAGVQEALIDELDILPEIVRSALQIRDRRFWDFLMKP